MTIQTELKREALHRQGTVVEAGGRPFRFEGSRRAALFEMGGEGLTQRATDVTSGALVRIKAFWVPDEARRTRSVFLAGERLADHRRSRADPLCGAPYDVLEDLGPNTPFAVLMKEVPGKSWSRLKDDWLIGGGGLSQPDLRTVATWSYALATAVKLMEAREFIHADLSPGNVVLSQSGDLGLVDFDCFVQSRHPDCLAVGTPGYAAPEIAGGGPVVVGSDRYGMAVLIREFFALASIDTLAPTSVPVLRDRLGQTSQALIALGHYPEVSWLRREHPSLAELYEETLRCSVPPKRPSPDEWRAVLRPIASAPRRHLRSTTRGTAVEIPLPDFGQVDLETSPLGIRAILGLEHDGAASLAPKGDARIRLRVPDKPTRDGLRALGHRQVGAWILVEGGGRVPIGDGMEFHEPRGAHNATFVAKEGDVGRVTPNEFDPPPPPVVKRVDPQLGPAAGGTRVVIFGSGFLPRASVRFGGLDAANVSVLGETEIVALTPKGAPGIVPVVVSNVDGQRSESGGTFGFVAPPSVAAFVPLRGPQAGGTRFTVYGESFQNGAAVLFGADAAPALDVVVDRRLITCTTPPGAPGAASVAVRNPDGQSSHSLCAYYYQPEPGLVDPPVILNVKGRMGTAGGGTIVTIEGVGFQPGLLVFFGEAEGQVEGLSPFEVSVRTPAGTPGTVSVKVVNPDGASFTLSDAFVFEVTYAGGNPARAAMATRRNLEYQAQRRAYQSLPWLKRLLTKEPKPPEGI